MPDLEINFPRGGEIIPDEPLTKRKRGKPVKLNVEKKKRKEDSEYEDVFTKVITRELLAVDVRGLGFVKRINEVDVILETVHGIQCTLSALDISDDFKKALGSVALDEIFMRGQAIAFKVIKAAITRDENPVITIDPSLVNSHLVPATCKNALVINGSVVSIEDKGAVINVGMGKVRGFVKSADLPPQWSLEKLHIGQVLLFRVRKDDKAASIAQRVLDLSAFSDMDVYDGESVSLAALMPGTIVSVEPQKSTKSGAFVATENGTKFFIHKSGLPPRVRLNPERFVKAIRAVVTCTLPNSPIIALSAMSDIVSTSKPERRLLPEEFQYDKIVKCTVYDVDKLGNVYFWLGEDDERPPAITAKALRRHFDNYEDDISRFGPGSRHKLRVVGYHAADRQVLVWTKKEPPKPRELRESVRQQQQRADGKTRAEGNERAKTDSTKTPAKMEPVTRPAKPFNVQKARVVGPWLCGGTSRYTTAELRFLGGSIGRLHASELPLDDYADASTPMIDFIDKHKGKLVEVKVMSVGARNTVTKAGLRLLEKKCNSTRFVECTMKPSKIAEPMRKLHLINYQTRFERGDQLPLFIGDASKAAVDGKMTLTVRAEANPLFHAQIPRRYIDRLKPARQPADGEFATVQSDVAFIVSNGELQRGVVISKTHTARAKIITAALGEHVIKEELEEDAELARKLQKDKRDAEVKDEADEDDSGSDVEEVKAELDEESDSEDENIHPLASNTNGDAKKATSKKAERRAKDVEAPIESIEELEQQIAASPNSSTVWIKYIAHCLCTENIVKARKIAERAIATISPQRTEDLFNVWTAFLNAELLFGVDNSWRPVLERAASALDALRMYKQAVKLLEHHNRAEELDELHESIIKKFKHEELDVWFAYATRLYETDRAEKARDLMKRALVTISQRNHTTIMSRFAQLEYRAGGDVERGKTLFEKLLQLHPKRADLWNIFADMTLKHEGITEARRIFERATTIGMSKNRTHSLFERWREAEQRNGTPNNATMKKIRAGCEQ